MYYDCLLTEEEAKQYELFKKFMMVYENEKRVEQFEFMLKLREKSNEL